MSLLMMTRVCEFQSTGLLAHGQRYAHGVADTQDEPAGDLYAGFESYRTPGQADYEHLFSAGMIVVDANVLLDLYLYHQQTRDEFIRVLERLQERLWVPHQAIKEFWRNRDSKIRDPRESDATSGELEKHSAETINHLRAWSNRVRLPSVDKDRLAETISQAFKAVIEEVKKQGADGAKELARDTNSDPLLLALTPLLKGRVSPPFSQQEHDAAVKEALLRIEKRQPPGYMDAGKDGTGSAGDYLIWAQILREAKIRQQDVLFVTSDDKEDWWRKDKDKKKSLGPRPELADELMHASGRRLFMLPPERFLDWARTVLGIEVSDESVQEVKQVSAKPDVSLFVTEIYDDDHRISRKYWEALVDHPATSPPSKDSAGREVTGIYYPPGTESRYLALLAALNPSDLQNIEDRPEFQQALLKLAIEMVAREQARHLKEAATSDSAVAEGSRDAEDD
jgi:predicted nucleic acid-binding protein